MTEIDVKKVSAEEVLAVAIEALGRARNGLDGVCKIWHREKEDDALRVCIRNLDIAGMAICAFREALGVGVEKKDVN